MDINNLKLTQLYLNQRKVDEVSEWLDDVSVKNTIISVIQYDNQFYIVDGHTRCFVAFQKGIIDISVEIYDIDNTSVEMQLYLDCIKWCEQENIYHINNLSNCILAEAEFEKLWIERCQSHMEDIQDTRDADIAYREHLNHKVNYTHEEVMKHFNL